MSAVNLYLEGIRDDIKTKAEDTSPEKYGSENDYHSYIDSLSDETEQLKEVEDTYKKLLVVGLYMIVERFTKKIMKWLYHDLDEDLKAEKLRILHKWERVKTELSFFCSFELSEVEEYSSVAELRRLNNVIKHSGYVDKYLAAFQSWRTELDKDVDVSLIDFEKFCNSIPKYIHNLVEKINENQKLPS